MFGKQQISGAPGRAEKMLSSRLSSPSFNNAVTKSHKLVLKPRQLIVEEYLTRPMEE
jgi:hypothetical protein